LLLVLMFSCTFLSGARASDADIRDVRTLLSDGVYRLGARIDFNLNDTLEQALLNGVPLVLELRIEVIRLSGEKLQHGCPAQLPRARRSPGLHRQHLRPAPD
jgi:hypothetical protein